jgi:predicted nucleotidyltransferase
VKTTNEYLTKIRQFKQQFAEKYGIISIGIFGSVARGEHRLDSDLDVFVELEEADPFTMFDIRETLESLCGCKVDCGEGT